MRFVDLTWFDAPSVAVKERNWLSGGWGIGGLWGADTSHVSVGGYWWEGYKLPLSGTQLIKPSQTRNLMSLLLLVPHFHASFMWSRNGSRCGDAHDTKEQVMVGLWRGCLQMKESSNLAAGRSGAWGPARRQVMTLK